MENKYKIVTDIKEYLLKRLDGLDDIFVKEINNLNNNLKFETDYKANYKGSCLLLKEFQRNRWHFSMILKSGKKRLNVRMVFDYTDEITVISINY